MSFSRAIDLATATEVASIAEITEPDTYYTPAGNTDPKVWLMIESGNGPHGTVYQLNAPLGLHNFETSGNWVQEWKTFKGVVRFIRRQAYKTHWIYSKFMSEAELVEARAEKERRTQKFVNEQEERQKAHNELWRKKVAAIDELAFLLETGEIEGLAVEGHEPSKVDSLEITVGDNRFYVRVIGMA